MAAIHFNELPLLDSVTNEVMGSCLLFSLSMVNHSCSPNALYYVTSDTGTALQDSHMASVSTSGEAVSATVCLSTM